MAYDTDHALEESTNRYMLAGGLLLIGMALVFPLYRWIEPTNRDAAREEQLESLATSGESLFALNCSSCHGINGEGGAGPALNAAQFLQSANDLQIESLIAVGVPGSQMSAYSQDFSGPLTSEQIKAIRVYIRSWEEDAPDFPNWRDPLAETADADSAESDSAEAVEDGAGEDEASEDE